MARPRRAGAWALVRDSLGLWLVVDGASLILVVLGMWHALAGRATDPVEGRRRFRLVLAIGSALYIAPVVVSELLHSGSTVAAPARLANAVGLASLADLLGRQYVVYAYLSWSLASPAIGWA